MRAETLSLAGKSSYSRRLPGGRKKRRAKKKWAHAGFTLLGGSLVDPHQYRWSIIVAVVISALKSPIALALFEAQMPHAALAADVAQDSLDDSASSDDAHPGIVHRAHDGLFYVRLKANGARFRCLIDTGASDLVLSSQQAAHAGVSPEDHEYIHRIATAGGSRSAAKTVVEAIDVAGRHFEDVPLVLVKGGQTPCLLGQHLLARFDEVNIHADELRLR